MSFDLLVLLLLNIELPFLLRLLLLFLLLFLSLFVRVLLLRFVFIVFLLLFLLVGFLLQFVRSRRVHYLIPVQSKLFFLQLTFFIFFTLFHHFLLFNILWFVFLFFLLFLGLLAGYDFASYNTQSHIVWTESRSSLVEMKRHVLSSIIVKVQSSFYFKVIESALLRQISINWEVVDTPLQFFLKKQSFSQNVHMVEIVQKI